jgi:predicted RNA-binding Zn ribbon-like protein
MARASSMRVNATDDSMPPKPIDHDHDLDLAVELVNTYWVLASPPDRLIDIGSYQRILHAAGDDDLAAQLKPDELQPLRALRADIAPIFDLPLEQAVERLDQLLRDAPVAARLAVHDGQAQWALGAYETGMTAIRSRLLIALADHLIKHGAIRIGVCHAAPCNCVYVDHSRARTRRYCCDQCNDRAAAAAYRQRQKRGR